MLAAVQQTAMGLFAGFKAYVTSSFPSCVRPNNDIGCESGVVLDVMCALHAFKPTEDEEAPAQRLADALWFSVFDADSVAFCFDVSENTPLAKAICWQSRAEPEVAVSAADIEQGLLFDLLPNYDAIISSRGARAALCLYLQRELTVRFRKCNEMPVRRAYFFGSDVVPVCVSWSDEVDDFDAEDGTPVGHEVVCTERPDLHKPMHGEADISCVFAAHVLRKECGAKVVEVRSVDTDIVMIASLHAFEGLRVQLAHFDRKQGAFVKVTFDIAELARCVTRQYRVSVLEWALLCITRGTDYASRSMSGVPDWAKYMDLLCPLARGKGCVTADAASVRVDTCALHGTIVSATAKTKRSKLLYKPNDGHLARCAWQLVYSLHAVFDNGPVPDCRCLGWMQTPEGIVQHASLPHSTVVLNTV